MTRTMVSRCAFAALLLPFSAAEVAAAPYVPPGLTPGSTYHLVFVSRDARDGISTNITDYNNFVQAQAALNPTLTGTNMGVTYRAIASTATDSALSNAPISAPVYNFNGQLVANNSIDMWNGTLANAIFYDQFANTGFPDVWSGTDQNGNPVGGSEMGTANPHTGLANLSTSRWIDDSNSPQNVPAALYALSQELTFPFQSSVTPEPSTMVLCAIGLVALCARRSPRRQRE